MNMFTGIINRHGTRNTQPATTFGLASIMHLLILWVMEMQTSFARRFEK
jgi:hypothetical protein